MSISLFRIACLIGLSCTIAFGEDHKKPSSALPPSLKKAIASLKSDKQSTHGNTPKAEELATIVGFSMKMTAAFSAKDHKELSKVLAKNKGGGTWCQLTKGRVAILFEFEGFEEVQGESREFFIGFLWGAFQGAAANIDPAPTEAAIGFVDASGVNCILRGQPFGKPTAKDLKSTDLHPFFK